MYAIRSYYGQLGIVREGDGALVLVSKNGQPAFNGAVTDLLPYCGKEVEVDGLLTGLPEYTAAKVRNNFV